MKTQVESIAERAAKLLHVAAEPAQSILLSNLRIAPWNARKTFDPATIGELAASIETQGLLVPLLVRPLAVMADVVQHPEQAAKGGDAFEIVAGHRRFHAVEQLNWRAVSCIVRELSYDQAREIGLIDNLQREDVPALEEADAYKHLELRLGSAAAIAQRVGKDVAYVTRRLQLVSLGEMPRRALAERLITVDHALLLARLGEEEQNANLKWALDVNAGIKVAVEKVVEQRIQDVKPGGRWQWEPQSPQRLKEHIEQHVGRKLSRAPWALDDANVVDGAPACSACPSNTAHNDTLFGDMNIAAATCEDGLCFLAKRTAFVQLRLVKATVLPGDAPDGVGIPALRVSWKQTTVKPRIDSKTGEFGLAQVFRHGQWIEAKSKSCGHVRQGVTVDWSDANDRGYMGSGSDKLRKPGQILNICIGEKCKVHKKSYGAAGKVAPGLRNENSDEAREERREAAERAEAAAKAENADRVALIGKALEGVKKIPGEILRRLLIEMCDGFWEIEERFPGIGKALQTKPVDSAGFARAAVCLVFAGDENKCFLSRYNPGEEKVEQGRKELAALLKLLGYDASKAWDKPAEPKPEKPAKTTAPAKKPILTAAAKKRIAEAQRKRWAAAKKKGGRK